MKYITSTKMIQDFMYHYKGGNISALMCCLRNQHGVNCLQLTGIF